MPADDECEDGVGVAPDLADIGPVVGGIEWHPQLLHDLSARGLERALEAAHVLPAEGVVLTDEDVLKHMGGVVMGVITSHSYAATLKRPQNVP